MLLAKKVLYIYPKTNFGTKPIINYIEEGWNAMCQAFEISWSLNF